MNGIILCEGSTDYSLLQYYMRKAYGWEDDKGRQQGVFKIKHQNSRKLFKDNSMLTIAAVGGCSRLEAGLKQVLERNFFASPNGTDFFDAVVLVTDRDEMETEQNYIGAFKRTLQENAVQQFNEIENNSWTGCAMVNNMGMERAFKFLLLVIPFEEKGAMETFLLNAIAKDDDYDRVIIDKCNNFVDSVDCEKRYLSNRRLITKAKFDTYFSIRTAAEQFVERHNILKNVSWEKYTVIQQDFKLLEELS